MKAKLMFLHFITHRFWKKVIVSLLMSSFFTFILTWYLTKGAILQTLEEDHAVSEAVVFFALCFVLSFLLATVMRIGQIIHTAQQDAAARWAALDESSSDKE